MNLIKIYFNLPSKVLTYNKGIYGLDSNSSQQDMWLTYIGESKDEPLALDNIIEDGPSNAVIIGSVCGVGGLIVLLATVVVVSVISLH